MEKEESSKDLYYTKDHAWIDFQGSVAYIGITRFKLTGIEEIQDVEYLGSAGYKKQGELLAVIKFDEYLIEAHMPVDGMVVRMNEALLCGDRSLLLQQPEDRGWIAFIAPARPYERLNLLISKQYQFKGKCRLSK